MAFQSVDESLNFPQMEEEVLRRWEETDAFKRSLQYAKEDECEPYTFYDGPPFATGLPHYGHILAGTIKDVVTRYASLNGKHVPRRFGWDCHGLPVEYEIDKKLNIKSSDDVAKMGIAKYNAECRGIVQRYTGEWEEVVKRMGRWIDFENDYKTMEPWYMESVWWVFKTVFDKGLVYKGFRVMPYSTGCTTPLSNFEATSNYKDVKDPAVVVTFPLVDEPEVAFVAWTTTPWTLPSNLGLCVNPEMAYVQIRDVGNGKRYILAEARLGELYPKMKKQKAKYEKGSEFVEEKRWKGAELAGKRYTPLFPFFKDHPKAFQVMVDAYVTEDSGTGVVHQAPAFGEDDMRVCTAHGVVVAGEELPCPVDGDGRFTAQVGEALAGRNVKEADEDICAQLKAMGRLVKKDSIMHSYPFCWRSDTPLIYKAVPSWFLKLDPIKERLMANNEETHWVPSNVRDGRFRNWLRDARDWNVSRNRYWGTPLPVWSSDDGEELVVVGSIAELQELTGATVTDLHRESIDHLEIPSRQGKGVLRRIPEVLDCWFESGSMPYAQVHYPFENKELLEKTFPADFIAEGIDQTRGWFYTLMVLSTALFDKPAFKNLIVNGMVLAADGKKMSKRLKNYPDPMEVAHKYGADALRLYLVNSPVVRAEELKFKEEGVLQNLKDIFNPWFNAYRFFVQNALRCEQQRGTQGWAFDRAGAAQRCAASANVMDKWIVAALHGLIKFFTEEMQAYRLYTVVPALVRFIDDLCNWYVKLNRSRMKGDSESSEGSEGEGEGGGLADTQAALSTMYTVLVALAQLMAPFTPFFAEFQYRRLVRPADGGREESVHFQSTPRYDPSLVDPETERNFGNMAEVVTMTRLLRGNDIPIRRPCRELIIVHEDRAVLDRLRTMEPYIMAEGNVQKVTYSTEEARYCRLSAKLNGSAEKDGVKLGKRLGKAMGKANKAVQQLGHAEIAELVRTGSATVADDVAIELADVFVNREAIIEPGSLFLGKVGLHSNITVLLDSFADGAIVASHIAREITNRVGKLRKNCGVKVGDVLDVFYHVSSGCDAGDDVREVEAAIAAHSDYINATVRRTLLPLAQKPSYAAVVGEHTEEIVTFHQEAAKTGPKAQVTIVLAAPCVKLLPEDQLAAALAIDLKLAKGTIAGVSSMERDWLEANASASLEITVEGQLVKLEHGKHYFLASKDSA